MSNTSGVKHEIPGEWLVMKFKYRGVFDYIIYRLDHVKNIMMN
jgi:hypothetical protein